MSSLSRKSLDFSVMTWFNMYMTKKYPLTVYRSGHSQVITLPKKLGLKVGDTLLLHQDEKNTDQFVLKKKITPKSDIEKNLEKLRELSGSFPGSAQGLSPEELDLSLEGLYD